ncbi:VacJ family lipoprotein [Phenylobacterium sp.]|uniref:MlaA family lipoprotein n=1 Tax=Phenylobacterium sp. TaxID=1871053 RepID=UPI00356541D0
MRRKSVIRFGAAAACLALGGCATVAGPPMATPPSNAAPAQVTAGDPFEGLNRRLFGFGQAFDRSFIRPLALGYERRAPTPLRRAIHNLLQNADEPVVFVNDVLQARFAPAAHTAARFLGNTTVGLGGLFDPMARAGAPHHDNDFGATLGRYGFGPGPYLFLPLIGPTSGRDAFGAGVDYVVDPLSWLKFRHAKTIGLARTALTLADARLEAEQDLQTLEATAVDPYATVRAVHRQSRALEVNGTEDELDALPELSPPPAPSQEAPSAAPKP